MELNFAFRRHGFRFICLSYLVVSLALAAIDFVPRVGERRLNILSELFDVFLEISVVLRRRGWRTRNLRVLKGSKTTVQIIPNEN